MEKSRIIIADRDMNYVSSLQLRLIRELFDKINLEIISDKEYFLELLLKPQNIDTMIVSEEFYTPILQNHNIENILVLAEENVTDDHDLPNVKKIFKYSNIKEILNEIVHRSFRGRNDTKADDIETRVLLVTSAVGGVGKTSVAMGIASCLEMNHKKVLYINVDRLQNFSYLMKNGTPISSVDIYSKLFGNNGNIYNEIKHVIRKEAFSYLPPFKTSLISLGLDISIFHRIILSAKKSGDYDIIIVDAESTFDDSKVKLMDMAQKVIIVSDPSVRSMEGTKLLIENIDGEVIENTMLLCNKYMQSSQGDSLIPAEFYRITFREFIGIMNPENQDIVHLITQCYSIKKISLLFL